MAGERLVRIFVPAAASDTHFRIQFSADGGASYLPYSTTLLNPSVPTDLEKGELDEEGFYLLDGRNLEVPPGNAAAASRAGNLYQVQLVDDGVEGNWSRAFASVFEPDDDGPLADPAGFIQRFGTLLLAYELPGGVGEHHDLLGRLLTDAMDEIRLDAGLSGLYTGTRTAAQGRVLARAEETIAAWLALTRPAVLRALGLHAPLDQETSTEIRELAASLRDDADRLLTLVGGTVETAETVGGALPLLITGTFEPGTLTIPPSEKLWNLDERDDRPAGVYP